LEAWQESGLRHPGVCALAQMLVQLELYKLIRT
jgi:hypothetical protein